MPIRIVTDSNCDLPRETVEKLNIAVVPFYINVGAKSYLDGIEMSRKEFYSRLPEFESHPQTSIPGPKALVEVFDTLREEGATEILAIHISESLSAMVNSVRLAAQEWGKLPVTVFDSGNLTLGTGLQVMAAAEAVAEGRSMDEIVALLEDLASRTYCFAALETVEFLRRSGRLTRFQHGLATVLSIKPLLKMHSGEAEMERVRTSQKAAQRLIELVTDLGPLEELAMVHTNAPQAAEELHQKTLSLFPKGRKELWAEVTPVIGTHIGPGAAGFVAVKAKSE